jgi:16S rRNA (uracil1498-N3)-methyltransferase
VHRFFVPPDLAQGERFSLTDTEARHATQVLRMRTGDPLTVLDGAGAEIRAVIDEAGRREVVVRVTERIQHPRPADELVLCLALSKGRAWDLVLEKATELGATRIVPMITQRCVVRIEAVDVEAKHAGWHATMISAAKQCGAWWMPAIAPPVFFDALARHVPAIRAVASLESDAVPVREFLRTLPAPGTGRAVAWLVGPEGDFSPEEYAALKAMGVHRVGLGPRVLRTETAAIALLALAAMA